MKMGRPRVSSVMRFLPVSRSRPRADLLDPGPAPVPGWSTRAAPHYLAERRPPNPWRGRDGWAAGGPVAPHTGAALPRPPADPRSARTPNHQRAKLDGVIVTVDLPDEALARLRIEATRRGISLVELIAELAEQLPPEATATREPLAFVDAGASAAGITPRMSSRA